MRPSGFDYIVAGGGSAGCVLAARLSENPSRSVLLLESGGWSRSIKITVPGLMAEAIGTPRFNWRYPVDEDPSMIHFPRRWNAGRLIGGGSSINGMVFARGAPSDYDEWSKAAGPEWGWGKLLPVFRRLEHWLGPSHEARGTAGPVYVAPLSDRPLITEKFAESAVMSGLPFAPDLNVGVGFGVGYTQTNQRAGRRHGAAQAYLNPARGRANLTIVTDALVTRLIFNAGRCVGAEFVAQRQRRTAVAEREVVLCAGAIGSPKVLLQSGIGPAEPLQSLGIALQLELPGVGQNLQEHASVALGYATRVRTYNSSARGLARAGNGIRWLATRKGPAASPANHVQGYFRADSALGTADVQLQFCPVGYALVSDRPVIARTDQVTIGITACHPQMRGAITLTSIDPMQPPAIRFALQGSGEDRDRLIRAAERVRHICSMSPIREYIAREVFPGPAVRSAQDWSEYFRRTTGVNYHPVGTCRMGTDDGAVVDPSLRVRGVEGLSVADASIMPRITSGNTNAPTLAIAEKAAELILGRTG